MPSAATFKLPRVYPITDTRLTGLSHLEQVRRLIDGGAQLIQLREKHLSPAEFVDDAASAIEFARRSGVRVLINDRVDIAMCAGADGVHLGQSDLPPEAARRLLGPAAIIGYSTHSTEQAAAAAKLSIDYIAIGPIFATSTKADPDPVVGLAGIAAVRSVIGDIPLVAIGGIKAADLGDVLASGADSAAIVSGILIPSETIADNIRSHIARIQ